MMALMGATSPRWLTPRRRRGAAALVGALASAVLLAGCPAADEPEETAGDAPLEIELVSEATRLSREDRDELQRQVGDVLSAYVVDAFLGDYPRDDFVDALTSFTSKAAERAAGDLELLTARNHRDADDVHARRLLARVSVFAPGGEPAGATARVSFRFVARDDGESVPFGVAGRLALVPADEGWRIFAYEMRRQQPAAGAGGAS